jgi:hypothetical protein
VTPGVSIEHLMQECARRFRLRVGHDWRAADLDRVDGAMKRGDEEDVIDKAVQSIATEVGRMERLPHVPAIAAELRKVLERHAPHAGQATPGPLEKRRALVRELDEPSFFGTGTEATDADLAVVSILSGIGLPDPAQRKDKTAAALIAAEARAIHKVRSGRRAS